MVGKAGSQHAWPSAFAGATCGSLQRAGAGCCSAGGAPKQRVSSEDHCGIDALFPGVCTCCCVNCGLATCAAERAAKLFIHARGLQGNEGGLFGGMLLLGIFYQRWSTAQR